MKRVFAICLFLIIPSLAFSTVITGGETVYRVVDGDGLLLISAKFGVDTGMITRKNNLNPAKPLQPGQELRLDTRKIVPHAVDNGIVVDIPGRMLYYFKAGNLEMFFPVGLGMPQWHGLTRWRTPSRTFTITGKERNPLWYVPESIQWQLHVEGKPVLKVVPPGPDNPLGRFALYTSIRGIAIHETIWPTTVFQFRSHGCIRVLPEHLRVRSILLLKSPRANAMPTGQNLKKYSVRLYCATNANGTGKLPRLLRSTDTLSVQLLITSAYIPLM